MNKLLSILLILALAAGMLTACGNEKKQETAPARSADAAAPAEENAAVPEEENTVGSVFDVVSGEDVAAPAEENTVTSVFDIVSGADAAETAEAPAEEAAPAVHHAAALKYPMDGMIVHAGSAEGSRLLAARRTADTFDMGIYSASGEKLYDIRMDETAREMMILAAGSARSRRERDKEKLDAYMTALQGMSDASLFQTYAMTEGNVITRVLSIRNDIAMCECCRSIMMTVDLRTGEMRYVSSQYQYPDGTSAEAPEVTEEEVPADVTPALLAYAAQMGMVRDAYFPSKDAMYALSSEYGADRKMTCRLTYLDTEGKQDRLCEIVLDTPSSPLMPLRIFMSPDGTICLPCSTLGGCYVILPGGHEAKFLAADTASMKLVYSEPAYPGYLQTYGFLPDGCLLCYVGDIGCLISVDPVTLDYQLLYINTNTDRDSGIDFLSASLFGNTLYLPKGMCIRVD